MWGEFEKSLRCGHPIFVLSSCMVGGRKPCWSRQIFASTIGFPWKGRLLKLYTYLRLYGFVFEGLKKVDHLSDSQTTRETLSWNGGGKTHGVDDQTHISCTFFVSLHIIYDHSSFIVIYHLWSFIIMTNIMLCYHSSFIMYLYLLWVIFLPGASCSHMTCWLTTLTCHLRRPLQQLKQRYSPTALWMAADFKRFSTPSLFLSSHDVRFLGIPRVVLVEDPSSHWYLFTDFKTNLPTKKVMQIAWPLDYWIRKNFRDILSKSWYSPRFIFRPTRTRVTNTKKHTTTRVILGDLKW